MGVSTLAKAVWLAVGTAVLGVLIGFYIAVYLQAKPPTVVYRPAAASMHPQTKVTLQTVASVGQGPRMRYVLARSSRRSF